MQHQSCLLLLILSAEATSCSIVPCNQHCDEDSLSNSHTSTFVFDCTCLVLQCVQREEDQRGGW